MEGEPMAGSAKAALDLIYDQECALLGGEFASAPVELFGYWTNSALTLNRFDHNGADVVCELFLEIFDVVETDELETRNEGLEGIAIFFLPCCRQRSKSASVE